MNSSSQLKRIESPFDFNTNNSNNSKTIRYQNTCNSAQLKNEHFNIKKFKSVIKKEHLKKLNQYKESLDKKIAELKEKLLENIINLHQIIMMVEVGLINSRKL